MGTVISLHGGEVDEATISRDFIKLSPIQVVDGSQSGVFKCLLSSIDWLLETRRIVGTVKIDLSTESVHVHNGLSLIPLLNVETRGTLIHVTVLLQREDNKQIVCAVSANLV